MNFIYIFIILIFNYSIFAQNLEKELDELYVSGKYDEVIVKVNELLVSQPENSNLNLLLGRSYVDKGLFNEGEVYLLNVCENPNSKIWMKAWAMNYLGRINYLKGNRFLAKKYFIDCINLNATKNVTNASKNLLIVSGLDDFYLNFEVVESEHITFHFQPNSIGIKKDEFVELREKAFQKISEFFGVKIPKKIDFIVWDSNEDARKLGIKSLGHAEPKFCVIHSRSNQTLGHEITHVITQYLAYDQIKTRLINEGIAVCFDLSNNNRLDIIDKQKENDSTQVIVSIKKAWNNSKAYPEWVYYPLAGELVFRMLNKWGKDKLLELLINQTYENALSIYGDELNTIISELENEIN